MVEHAHKASALMIFPDIENACKAATTLKSEPVAAVELMDRAALRSVENKPGMQAYLERAFRYRHRAPGGDPGQQSRTPLIAQIETVTKSLTAHHTYASH